MHLSSRTACAVFLGTLCAHGMATSAEVQIEEQILVPDVTAAQLVISARGVHVAAVVPKGSRQAVVIDGVEGPRFDEIQQLGGIFEFDGMGGQGQSSHLVAPTHTGQAVGGMGAGSGTPRAIFNRNGSHCAYVGRSGSDVVLMLDNKEVHRGPYQQYAWLAFTPDGTRLIGAATHADGRISIIVDGEPGPVGATNNGNVYVTADGAHYAYVGQNLDGAQWMVVDGRQVKFLGDIVGFTTTGALFTRTAASYNQILLANGKVMAQASSFDFLAVNGNRLVLAATPPLGNPPQRKPRVLTVDGQVIPGTEDVHVNQAWFSPDGKRYAILCQQTSPVIETFMIVDGKKELGYQSIYTSGPYAPSFSPDSSKFLYVAMASNGGMFVVVNGEESDAVQTIHTNPVWSPVGSRLAWGGVTSARRQLFYLDGKLAPLVKNTQPGPTFGFSSDGAHYTWSFGTPYALSLIVDGKEIPDVGGMPLTGSEAVDGSYTTVRISPDGQHTAYLGIDAKDASRRGFWVDHKLISASPNNPQINRVTFTPDSQHVAWADAAVRNNVGGIRVVVDGREVLWYERTQLDNTPGAWEMAADGTLTLLGVHEGALKRYHIPTPADSSITSMLAAAK